MTVRLLDIVDEVSYTKNSGEVIEIDDNEISRLVGVAHELMDEPDFWSDMKLEKKNKKGSTNA